MTGDLPPALESKPPPVPELEMGALIAIEEQITELEVDALWATSKLAKAIAEYRIAWCPCRLVAIMEPLSKSARNSIASGIGFADADHIASLTSPCSCEDLWFEGVFPVDVTLPNRPGVYVCHDEQRRVAYVGTSKKDIRGRLTVHFRDPEKPRLASWWAFYPGQFNDSAAVWEIRLIERLQPYLNRQHLDGGAEVDWAPQGYVPPLPREAWWNRDDDYLQFVALAGSRVDRSLSEPWQVATMIKKLLKEGIDWELIDEACDITASKDLDGPAMPYFAGVARNLAAQRQL